MSRQVEPTPVLHSGMPGLDKVESGEGLLTGIARLPSEQRVERSVGEQDLEGS